MAAEAAEAKGAVAERSGVKTPPHFECCAVSLEDATLGERAGAAACAWEPGKALVHGGSTAAGVCFSDVLIWDTECGQVQRQECSGDAPATSGHTLVLAKDGSAVACGGMNAPQSAIFNSVWRLDTKEWAWELVDVACGAVPEPRTGHTCAVLGEGMWMVGGASPEAGPLGDVWVLWMPEGRQWMWQPVQATGPPLAPRELHCATLTDDGEGGSRLAVWGGKGAKGVHNTLQVLSLPVSAQAMGSSTDEALAGAAWGEEVALEHSVAASTPAVRVGDSAVSVGGFDGKAPCACCWVLTWEGGWALQRVEGHLPAVFAASAIAAASGDGLLTLGGLGPTGEACAPLKLQLSV